MTLGTHFVVGVAAATPFLGNPWASFVAGFISHFFIDAVPHLDWPLKSIAMPEDRQQKMEGEVVPEVGAFLHDIVISLVDIAIGAALVWGVLALTDARVLLLNVFLAGIGGVLPDPMQLLYFLIKREPLISIQHFHDWIHSRVKIPHERWVAGFFLQLPIVVIALGVIALAVA